MKKLQTLGATLASVAALLSANDSHAQISVTSGGFTYNQDFNNLTRSTTAENWVDNVDTTSGLDSPRLIGLLGWYAASFTNASTSFFNTTYTPLIRAGTGSSTAGSFYSFGASGDADRALGTLPSDSTTGTGAGALRLGARFVNNTGTDISGFTFSYDGEQWRKGAVTGENNQYSVGYSVFAPGSGNLVTSFYTPLAGANFNTPNDGDGTGAALDGNAAANRIAGLGATVTGLSIAPGQEIWIRWSDANSSGADHGLAIDNFSIIFEVPEPAAATILGLGLAVLIRRVRRA
jgi:hypothetical protein